MGEGRGGAYRAQRDSRRAPPRQAPATRAIGRQPAERRRHETRRSSLRASRSITVGSSAPPVRETWKDEARNALETVGLLERGGDRVGTFSKGMQQRLGLGVALLGDPTLVVLDEPTSALDPVGRHDVREIIRGLRERSATVFLNTHLLEEAERVCDRVTVIDKGTAIATGTLEELLDRHSRLRLKVGGLSESWWSGLGRFGRWHRQGEWVVVEGIDRARIPDLVEEVVALGGRVEA